MSAAVPDVDPVGRFVRPYALTSGRTRSRGDEQLPLETLVAAAPADRARLGALAPAERRVVELCRSTVSIAEVSGLLDVPLGVARVVVGDLAVEGLVELHRPAPATDDGPDLELLERVLNGLERL